MIWWPRTILSFLTLGLGTTLGLLNFWAFQYNWYWKIFWFDWVMHFLGGWLIGTVILLVYLSLRPDKLEPLSARFLLGVVLGGILITGGIWELFEFSVDAYWATHVTIKTIATLQMGAWDSLSDMMFGLLGGLVWSSIYFYSYNFLINQIKQNDERGQAE